VRGAPGRPVDLEQVRVALHQQDRLAELLGTLGDHGLDGLERALLGRRVRDVADDRRRRYGRPGGVRVYELSNPHALFRFRSVACH